MANRMREDEKNEKIIRGLLKLPANRRCINCNNLGPQYVCTNFMTFICTNCSGVHREFTHRVKSVSMAKFTTTEVNALQEGGNELAKEIFFKDWDPQRHSYPDSSNIDRLRDFIKHVYVDRRYTGERITDKPPKVKLGDREEFNENRRADSYRGGSRSPPYDDRYSERAVSGGRNDARNFRYNYEERSPGYDHVDNKRSPGRFEVVDERRRDDRFGNGNQNRRFEDRGLPDGVPKPDGRSPNHQKDINVSSPPMVRPVRDILGDDTPTLRVGEPPKSNGTRIPDNSSQTQRTSSSSSMGSSDGTSVQLKRVNSGSLIDFNADPDPHVPATPSQSASKQIPTPPADNADWASFGISGQQKAPHAPANTSTLESALAQLSAPGSVPIGNMSVLPVSSVDFFSNTDGGGPTNTQQQQSSLFIAANNQVTSPQSNAPVGVLNQSLGSSLAPNFQAPLTIPDGLPSEAATKQTQEKSAGGFPQPPPEAKPSGRKELPADLFAALYPPAHAPAPGWQRGPHLGMGYGMQYYAGVAIPTLTHSSKSTNPFDLNEPTQAHMFPSMAPLQGALPNVTAPAPLLHTSSFGASSPQWVPPQQPSYPSPAFQSPYMVQQISSNMPHQVPNNSIPMPHQGIGGPGVGGAFHGTLGMDHHSTPKYFQQGASNSFGTVGGNPFG